MPAIQVVSSVADRDFQRLTGNDVVADTSIRNLKIRQTLKTIGLDLDVTRTITSGSVTDSFTAAPQLVFTILDRGYKALNSGIFDDVVEVSLDGAVYRLVQVSLTDTETLQLTWEHKIVALLRTKKSFLAVQRGAMTRAQFIELLLREILDEFADIVFVCPEVNTVQPIAGPRQTGRSLTKKTLASKKKTSGAKGGGFGLTHMDITDWNGQAVTIGPSQLANAALAIQTCQQAGASEKVTIAILEACIVEPSKPFENTTAQASPAGHAGILQMQSRWSFAPDVAKSVEYALKTGASSKGGMIALARQNPGWSSGQIAEGEQASGQGSRYDQAQTGAKQVLDAYHGTSTASSSGATQLAGSLAATQQYEFTRGRSGQTEDSYTCALRLAAEVGWRFFVAGRHTAYFVTDDDLLQAPAKYTITPRTQGVAQPTFDIQKGGRTIVQHRHRVPKPSEGQLSVRIGRWDAVVGDVVKYSGWGPADDRWLIKEVQRDLFDKTGTIGVQAPQKPLKEPAASTSTNIQAGTGGSSGTVTGKGSNAVDRVYAAAQAISARNLPYVYGGGHTGSWATAMRSTGLDCSSSVSLALWAGGLMQGFSAPIVSGAFSGWGQPGRGSQITVWFNGGHVFIEFYGRPAKRFDTVPGGSGGDGPHLRYTAPGDAGDTWEATGFQARHPQGL